MKSIRYTMRDAAREVLATVPPPELAALCHRVPEVRALRERIDAEDFPTRQECADALHFLVTGGRTFELLQETQR
jgi:hypothetical protein